LAEQPPALRSWLAVAAARDPALLSALLADEVEFRSPAVFAPQTGKSVATVYLTAALRVLGPSLRYVAEWYDAGSAVLEFEATLDGVYLQGVDILRWNGHDKVISFTVMARPLRGLEKLIDLMSRELEALRNL
jgi:hypothetical protein